jgi:hypothetical protein
VNKNKFLALSLTAAMLTTGAGIGLGTYALFNSSAASQANNMTAGTINLEQERDSGDSVPGPMFYGSTDDTTGMLPYDVDKTAGDALGGETPGNWAPGDTVTRAMNLYNRGSLQAKITKLRATVNAGGLQPGDPAYEEFISKMNIKVTYTTGGNQVLYNGTLRDLIKTNNDWATIGPIYAAAHSGALNVAFEAHLDSSAGNDIKGKKFVFDFSFLAEQASHN